MTKKHDTPWAYFLTFRTYATFLPGDDRLSVDVKNNIFNTPKMASNPNLKKSMQSLCQESALILTLPQCDTVLKSICRTCRYFNWQLIAAHVRTNHVHVIVQSSITKENTLGKLKAYATCALKKEYSELLGRKKFWAIHGSTKMLWDAESAFPAICYVVAEQGEPMGLYYDKKIYDAYDPRLYELLSGK